MMSGLSIAVARAAVQVVGRVRTANPMGGLFSSRVAVAARSGVSRETVHAWLARYEAGELAGLADGSHRPR